MSLPIEQRTPKKFLKSDTSSCRLCSSVGDRSRSKNLFKNNNHELLCLAQNVLGESIPRHENLPHLVCRPCERRLLNFKDLRTKIQECQKTLERRSKRCVEMSPSLVPVASTVERGGRRGNYPGPGPRRGPQKIQSRKIYHTL